MKGVEFLALVECSCVWLKQSMLLSILTWTRKPSPQSLAQKGSRGLAPSKQPWVGIELRG